MRGEAKVTDRPSTGQATAKKAVEILVEKGDGYVVPTSDQKKNLVVAFAKRNMIVYGKAFDIVRLHGDVDLDNLAAIEEHLDQIVLCEVKSTRKDVDSDFNGYFFALTAAEVLVAQSLKERFKFVLLNTNTKAHLELKLNESFARAKGIYPTWSIAF